MYPHFYFQPIILLFILCKYPSNSACHPKCKQKCFVPKCSQSTFSRNPARGRTLHPPSCDDGVLGAPHPLSPSSLPAGDDGVLRAPHPLRVLLLLPAGRRGLLRAAHRDHRPGPPGVQPAGVGSGDDGPAPKPSRGPPLQLWLPELRRTLGQCEEKNGRREEQSKDPPPATKSPDKRSWGRWSLSTCSFSLMITIFYRWRVW